MTSTRGIFFYGTLTLTLALSACDREANDKPVADASSAATVSGPAGMTLIPAGEFIMGSDDVDTSGKSEEFGFNEPWYLNEHPKRKVYLDAFYIDTYEVSNGQFKTYLMNTMRVSREQLAQGIQSMGWEQNGLPVKNVPWNHAQAYCESVGKRLPTEAEWEKAARGPDGFEFPWGNEFNPDYVNAGGEEENLMPVKSYDKGRSPYGVYNMAGNVMEWVEDWYEAYPGSSYKSKHYGHKRKVARGGSWGGVGHYVIPHYFRGAYRYSYPPDGFYNDVGFRCARNAPRENS